MTFISNFCSLLLFSSCCIIPGVLSEDYEYVVVFMENFVEELSVQQDVELYVASRSTFEVTVTIDNPNGNLLPVPISFTLAPESVKMRTLPAAVRLDNGLDNKAIRIVGDGDIIVYALNRNLYSTDGFTSFRIDQTGKEHYALAYTPLSATQIAVAAVEDGVTEVEIMVPSQTTLEWLGVRYTAGQVLTITLTAKYQTAQLSAVEQGDLTGAKILSTKKISAFSGNIRTNVEGNSRDHLIVQLPPMPQWGFTYYTVRTPGRSDDRVDIVRVVAHLDNTIVEVNGAVNKQFVLNAGEYEELSTGGALSINSGNQSVMVGVISTSQSLSQSTADEGDPSMIIMPALGQFSNIYIFSTPSYIKPPNSPSTQYDIYVLIIVKTAEIGGLRLNNAALGNAGWIVIAGSDYSSGQISVDNDRTYNLQHTDGDVSFMALLYGSADKESFYFPIDVGMANINVITPVEVVGNKGEKGGKGRRGATGNSASQGPAGATGSTGSRGSRGDVGQKGDKGDPGSSSQVGATGTGGVPGLPGIAGQAGATGLQGAVGATGATGVTGAQGSKGNQGLSGFTGEPGIFGNVGPPGNPGVQGRKGSKGFTGAQGSSGEVGPDGEEGNRGAIGAASCDNKCRVRYSTKMVATCRSTYGTVRHLCSCPPGFHLLESNPNLCIDIDECDLELCSHYCENTVGSYICGCPAGYTNSTGNHCVDIDECRDDPCGDNICINGIGSFLCMPSSTPLPQVSRAGLKSLYSPDYFKGILFLLLLLTLLTIIVALCLLSRLRNRHRAQKLKDYPDIPPFHPRPASVVLQDNYY